MFDRSRAYRQITRGVLGEYLILKKKIKTLPERIETENYRLTAIRSAASESEAVAGTGANVRQERDTAIIAERDRLTSELKLAKIEVQCIEHALSLLNEKELRTIQLMDIERQYGAVDRLCAEFNYCKSMVYNIHDSALDKFSMAYNGAK